MTNYSSPQQLPHDAGTTGPRSTSGAAITSLILGLLLCIPFLTSLGAVIFGFIGLGATKNGQRGGRGLAVAGLILGIVGLLGWTIGGGIAAIGGWSVYTNSEPARQTARQFITDLANNDVDAAEAAFYGTGNREDLQGIADYIDEMYGSDATVTDVSFNQFNFNSSGGITIWSLEGVVTFSTGSKATYLADLRDGDEGPKVTATEIQ